ncbi:hypothetical protein BDA96_07G232100 [Sorghum bicolor]|uniref:Dirigent protein n=2 Tax=Sorghum bicolor TaxID=4558 RepID=A0A921QMD8_SORBI|nr:hypothetical protein BDA96_07G232100 [Sorghum bicolor]KXG25689.1 hypothetical protein SORBI_3007G218400 [Sorghum bicolor]
MGASRTPLLALAVVLLLAAAMTVGCHEHVLARLANDPIAERPHKSVVTGAGVSATGAVEDDKAYIVGRPLFKVPPSSPCRAKSARC